MPKTTSIFKNTLLTLIYSTLAFLFVLSIAYWTSVASNAQETDAIAIYIKMNPNKYSALRWYIEDSKANEKEYSGSPAQILVDGYEAIKDGRTVYVNAGNQDGATYHANIYMLSYTQDAHPSTALVFNNMLSHWTFNTNMTNDGDYGACTISAISCLSSSECAEGYECRNNASLGPIDNKCHLPQAEEAEKTCWKDSDCGDKIYCDGGKASVTRKTRRLAGLAELKILLKEYFEENGNYPSLDIGTYVPGRTLSTWESWTDTDDSLGEKLGVANLPIDPINIMGVCPGNYDPDTCWNETTKDYNGSFDANGVALGPPGGSFLGYSGDRVYSFSEDGTLELLLD